VLDGERPLGRGESTRALGAGYAPTLARLRAAARRVAVLTDVPRPPKDIPSCVSGAMRQLRRRARAGAGERVRDPRRSRPRPGHRYGRRKLAVMWPLLR
jgi:hypothetical protein